MPVHKAYFHITALAYNTNAGAQSTPGEALSHAAAAAADQVCLLQPSKVRPSWAGCT